LKGYQGYESGRRYNHRDALELEAPRLRLRGMPPLYQSKTERGTLSHEVCRRSRAAENAEVAEIRMGSNMSEAVNHPPHYGGDTTYEAIKVIEAWNLGFRLGNVLKYIRRAQHKDNLLQNLQKARWYLDREIAALEATERTTRSDSQSASIQTQEEKSWSNLVQRKETEDV
jgi:hypothetical protein